MNSTEKKLLIIEMDYHSEVLAPLLRVIEMVNHKYILVTKKKIWNQLRIENHNNVVLIKEDYDNMKLFVNKIKTYIPETDLVLFNTLRSYLSYFKGLFKDIPVVARVHNSNAYFTKLSDNYRLRYSPFYIWKDVSYFIRKNLFENEIRNRTNQLSNVDFFSFMSQEQKKYAISSQMVKYKRVLENSFPTIIVDEKTKSLAPKKDNQLIISVLGKIDPRKRNYDLFYSTIEIVRKEIKEEIKIYFLGDSKTLYGKKLRQKFSKLEESIETFYYNGFVPQAEFNKIISQSDMIVNPIYPTVRFNLYEELYGKSKISGSVNDMIVLNKPCLVPDFYKLPEGINIDLKYSNTPQGLSKKIIETYRMKEFDIVEFRKQFFVENVKQKYLDSVEEVITKFKKSSLVYG